MNHRVRYAARLAAVASSFALAAAASPAATAVTPAGAHSAAVQTVRLVTFNMAKYLDDPKKWQADWDTLKKHADIVFLQEASKVRVGSLTNTNTWIVLQAGGKYSSEEALAFRKAAISSVSPLSVVKMLRHQSCGAKGGVGARFIAWAHVVLQDGRNLTVATTHLPPRRCFGDPYNTMMTRVKRWAKAHQGGLVLGADWNKWVENDPGNFSASTDLRPHGVGIDGFQIDKGLPVDSTRKLGARRDYNSDHNPVQVTITR